VSRKPSNSKSGLDRITVLNEVSASQYLKVCGELLSSLDYKLSVRNVYSRSINDNGWVCPGGLTAVRTQGLIKSAIWTVKEIKKRAESGDAEAQVIIENIDSIVRNSHQK